VGFEEEQFYIPKGNCCAAIGWYKVAIAAYTKALEESNDPLIHSALGWCYAEVGMNEKSLEHYRIAYTNSDTPEMAIGLAYAEYNVGNIQEFQNIYKTLNDSKVGLSGELKDQFEKLEKLWINVASTTDSKIRA
jgi:tetratricopeptide (TPR) repeat protein